MKPAADQTIHLRQLLEGRQVVPVQRHDGEMAVLVRVYWPNGYHTDHKVAPAVERPRKGSFTDGPESFPDRPNLNRRQK